MNRSGLITVRGLGALGAVRPYFDYVRTGDVIRVQVFLDAAALGYGATEFNRFHNTMISQPAFELLATDASQLSFLHNDGPLIVDVRSRMDRAHLSDVVGDVAHIAYLAGFSVLTSSTRGEFASRVPDEGGGAQPVNTTIPAPSGSTYYSPGSAGPSAKGPLDSIGDFVKRLAEQPVTLSLIIGGLVVLVIAAKD